MDEMFMAGCCGGKAGTRPNVCWTETVGAPLTGKLTPSARRSHAGAYAAHRPTLLAAVLLVNALLVLALSYAALYRPLERAVGAVCAHASYQVLVYGGGLAPDAVARLNGALPEGVELMCGDDGAVYGYAAASSAWSCALSELRLRGVLGATARADRWVTAVGATRVRQRAGLPVERGGGAAELAAQAERLLEACGDAALTRYVGPGCASARGADYHAAVRAGATLEYMLADGYLPVDY